MCNINYSFKTFAIIDKKFVILMISNVKSPSLLNMILSFFFVTKEHFYEFYLIRGTRHVKIVKLSIAHEILLYSGFRQPEYRYVTK